MAPNGAIQVQCKRCSLPVHGYALLWVNMCRRAVMHKHNLTDPIKGIISCGFGLPKNNHDDNLYDICIYITSYVHHGDE